MIDDATDEGPSPRRRRASDSPIAIAARALQTIAAIVALALAIIALSDITGSRRQSAVDSCHLLKGLVLSAVARDPAGQAGAQSFIHHSVLRDCQLYAHVLVK